MKLSEARLRSFVAESVRDVLLEIGNNFPSYEEWRTRIESEVAWHKYDGKSNMWRIGKNIVLDSNEHALNHIGPSLLYKVLQRVDFNQVNPNGIIEQAITFPYPVGYQECVETGENDRIIYVQRANRNRQSRFVLDREPELCNTVFIVLGRDKNNPNKWRIYTAYVGAQSGKEPWDKRATSTDVDFWKNHALVSADGYTEDDDIGDEGYWRKVVEGIVRKVLIKL